MPLNDILFLKPTFSHTVWGGDKLRTEFGYDEQGDDIGECWGISAHPQGDDLIAEGTYEGKHLSELWSEHRELFGGAEGDRFPLLTKIISAKDDLSIQVHPDDVYAGELMATYIQEMCPDGGSYIHCQGVIGNSAQMQRGEGIQNILGDDDKFVSEGDFPCDWKADLASNAATDAMSMYGEDLVAIICDNDDMSSAAQQACNEAGREDIFCIGVDGNQGPLAMIKDGTLGATVLQDGVGQMKAGIDAIELDINGEEVEKEYVVPFVLVNADNVDEYLQ